MKTKQNRIFNYSNPEFKTDKIQIQTFAKWVDEGTYYQGTVIDIFVKHGVNQLVVITIFGKRCTVKMSKVKLVKAISRCNMREEIIKLV
jgi:hypothetical protein